MKCLRKAPQLSVCKAGFNVSSCKVNVCKRVYQNYCFHLMSTWNINKALVITMEYSCKCKSAYKRKWSRSTPGVKLISGYASDFWDSCALKTCYKFEHRSHRTMNGYKRIQ